MKEFDLAGANLRTAAQALASVVDNTGLPVDYQSAFVCPHPDCRAFAVHQWGFVGGVGSQGSSGYKHREKGACPVIALALCTSCKREVVFVGGLMVHPFVGEAPAAAADLPKEVKADYEEASRIYAISPRGAAALLRLLIQKLLPILGASAPDINRAIGELVEKGIINSAIQKALDTVRVIGNEAVHPGTMDLTDDAPTALSLFGLINFIVEKAITEPNEIAAIYGGLPPAKLAGIEQRDAKKT